MLSGKELPNARDNATTSKLSKKQISQLSKTRKISKSYDKRQRKDSPLFSQRGPGQAPKIKGEMDEGVGGGDNAVNILELDPSN